jgi:hypothetical protein
MYLNEATLLNNVRRRYKKDLIYVLKKTNFEREKLFY